MAGSTKNTTGMSIVCPGWSVWRLKQKQAILLKYLPAWAGLTLKVAIPLIGWSERFSAMKTDMSRAPMLNGAGKLIGDFTVARPDEERFLSLRELTRSRHSLEDIYVQVTKPEEDN